MLVAGVLSVQNYILKEVKKVYNAQGIEISDKHIEVMVRQMLKKVLITKGNDSGISAGMTISLPRITDINADVLSDGKIPAIFTPTLLGISKASVETDSFLSAASFQETTKVLTEAAMKENVIIGKLIPAGTGAEFGRETSARITARAAVLHAEREERNYHPDEPMPAEMFIKTKFDKRNKFNNDYDE